MQSIKKTNTCHVCHRDRLENLFLNLNTPNIRFILIGEANTTGKCVSPMIHLHADVTSNLYLTYSKKQGGGIGFTQYLNHINLNVFI